MQTEAALIVNGKSRRGREQFELVQSEMREAGFSLVVSELANSARQLSALTASAVRNRIPIVCIGAGDGGLSLAAKHFVGKEATLGVIPLGTGNSLARDLGIPVDIKAAVGIVSEGYKKKIDVGQVHDQVFLNVATVGLTTRIAEALNDDAKKRFGRAAYLWAIIKGVIKARPFSASLTIDGKLHEFQSVQIVVANGRFHAGPFPVTPGAQIASGHLAGYVLTCTKRTTLLKYAFNLWRHRHVEMSEVFPFEATEIKLTSDPRKRITIDGEIKLRTPAEFRVLPSAINVFVPQPE